MEGSGRITVNRRRMTDYFPAMARRLDVLRPFEVTNTLGAFNVMSTVRGGGSTGAAMPPCTGQQMTLHEGVLLSRCSCKVAPVSVCGVLTAGSAMKHSSVSGRADCMSWRRASSGLAAWHCTRPATLRAGPASSTEGRGPPDARLAGGRAQETRLSKGSQGLPVGQALSIASACSAGQVGTLHIGMSGQVGLRHVHPDSSHVITGRTLASAICCCKFRSQHCKGDPGHAKLCIKVRIASAAGRTVERRHSLRPPLQHPPRQTGLLLSARSRWQSSSC